MENHILNRSYYENVPVRIIKKVERALPEGHKLLNVIRHSNHPEDYYLYRVLAMIDESAYTVWTCFNDTTDGLNFGHYGLDYPTALDVLWDVTDVYKDCMSLHFNFYLQASDSGITLYRLTDPIVLIKKRENEDTDISLEQEMNRFKEKWDSFQNLQEGISYLAEKYNTRIHDVEKDTCSECGYTGAIYWHDIARIFVNEKFIYIPITAPVELHADGTYHLDNLIEKIIEDYEVAEDGDVTLWSMEGEMDIPSDVKIPYPCPGAYCHRCDASL